MASMDKAQAEEIRNNVSVAKDAMVEGARQMAILWEARLNMAITAGDEDSMRSVLRDAHAMRYMDNCNCGGAPA